MKAVRKHARRIRLSAARGIDGELDALAFHFEEYALWRIDHPAVERQLAAEPVPAGSIEDNLTADYALPMHLCDWALVVPLPSCPFVFDPQHHTAPPVVSAQVWAPPAAIARLQQANCIVMEEALTVGVPYFDASMHAPRFSHLMLTGGAIGEGAVAAALQGWHKPDGHGGGLPKRVVV